MTHDAAVLKAREIASRVLAPSAGQNDRAGRFSTEAVESLGKAGLLGLSLPVDFGGSGLGPRTFAVVTATLAEADASVAMVYLMHILGATTISAARPSAARALTPILQEIGAGRHLSTLAFSEAGSRSHFWAPMSRAQRNGNGVRISAKKFVGDQRGSCAELCGFCACPGRGGTYRFDPLSSCRGDTRPFSCGALGWVGTPGQRFCADYAGRLPGSSRFSAH